MIEWLIVLFTFSITYLAFFWKINYVKGLDSNNNPSNYFRKNKRKVGDIPPVYPNGWFALLESSDLKKGQVKHVAALGENFAVFRTEKGTVNILDAYCPHLGANLAEGGKVKGDVLECPFHSWTFGGDGQCKSIPYAKTVPSMIKTKVWQCREVNQIIFVWYHAESVEPQWEIESVHEITNGNWMYQGRNEFVINSHIQEIPENGADWAHLNAVHGPPMFFNSIPPTYGHHSWTGSGWRPLVADNSPEDINNNDDDNDIINNNSNVNNELNHRAVINLNHSLVVFNKYPIIKLEVKAEQIGPGYVVLNINTSIGQMCILQTVTPIEPLLQRVTHIIFSPLILSPYAKIIFLGECLMFERDISVWNHKKFQKNPTLVREDRTIAAYRRWYSQFYTPNSPTYHSNKTLEW